MHTDEIEAFTCREIAAKHRIDPRTLEKAARGESVRGLAGRRARAALDELHQRHAQQPANR